MCHFCGCTTQSGYTKPFLESYVEAVIKEIELVSKDINKSNYGTGGHAAKYYGIGVESDPLTWNLPAEFNDINHKRGILSMARSNNPNSGGSQFFIVPEDSTPSHLDGQHTVFGKVSSGLSSVTAISDVDTDGNDRPDYEVRLLSVVIS